MSELSMRTRSIHPAWWVAAVTLLALVGAVGFRAVPGVLMEPLQVEFGWSVTTISAAVAVNMALYGLTAPFAAALMERFGIRPVITAALVVVAAGSGLTVFMTQSWQLGLCWGVLVGLGTGSMALALERLGVGAALRRSRALVRGSWWRTFGTLLFASLIVGVPAVLLLFAVGGVPARPVPVISPLAEQILATLLSGGDRGAHHDRCAGARPALPGPADPAGALRPHPRRVGRVAASAATHPTGR